MLYYTFILSFYLFLAPCFEDSFIPVFFAQITLFSADSSVGNDRAPLSRGGGAAFSLHSSSFLSPLQPDSRVVCENASLWPFLYMRASW